MAEGDSTSTTPVGHSGYLDKESKNSKWNKRFFVLEGATLRYYKDDPEKLPEEERQSRGEIKIKRISGVCETTVKDHKSCFEIQMSSGPIYLAANTDEERLAWIECLQLAAKRYGLLNAASFDVNSPIGAAKKDTSGYQTKVVGGVIVRIPIHTEADATDPCEAESGGVDRAHGAAPEGIIRSYSSHDSLRHVEKCAPATPHHRKDGARVIRCGYAVKQGNVRKNWKRRFFLLDPFGFAYYHNELEKDPIKNIPIQDIVTASPSVAFPDRENVFQVVTSGRTFYIQTNSSEEMNLWITAIQNELTGAVRGGAPERTRRSTAVS